MFNRISKILHNFLLLDFIFGVLFLIYFSLDVSFIFFSIKEKDLLMVFSAFLSLFGILVALNIFWIQKKDANKFKKEIFSYLDIPLKTKNKYYKTFPFDKKTFK